MLYTQSERNYFNVKYAEHRHQNPIEFFEYLIDYTYVSSAISETNNGMAILVPPPAIPAKTLAAYKNSILSASTTVNQNIF